MAFTLFLRDFTVLDCAVLCPETGLRGESLYVSAELEGTLDEKDFLLDFGPAKKILKQKIDASLDHALLLPKGVSWPQGFRYEAPSGAIYQLSGEKADPRSLEAELVQIVAPLLPTNVKSLRFTLREDPRFLTEPSYRYTHGLRYHDGNCQRLLHGHRNPIEVWQKGARLTHWEKRLCELWSNAHFASVNTLENRAELDLPVGTRQPAHPGTARIAYRSPQGNFLAELPASRVILLEGEPSVENLAKLAVETLRQLGAEGPLRVVAYEGLNKGAAYNA